MTELEILSNPWIHADERIAAMENEASIERPQEARYPITFDNGPRLLRVIADAGYQQRQTPTFIYRRGGIDLTREQAVNLLARQYQERDTSADWFEDHDIAHLVKE